MAHPSNKSKRSLASRFDYQVLEPRKLLAAISVGDLNSGVAVSEDASGVGFILYSQQDVHARFGGIRADNADHFIAARLDGVQWQYNDDSQWVDFQSADTDLIVAEVNFDGEDSVLRDFQPFAVEGIRYRGQINTIDNENDLYVVANTFGGEADDNEFQILGTQFQDSSVESDFLGPLLDNSKLSRIWLGALEYESQLRSFPTLANFDADGNPLLSWRVHILPQLGYQNLYDQFRLDEPWNSPHNLALADQMPSLYQSNHFESSNRTSYLAVAGEDTIFPLDNTPQGFSNETSLALVEANESRSVIWTQPVDWYFNASDPLAGLGDASPEGFYAIDVQGQQHFLDNQVDADAFASFVRINDGVTNDFSSFTNRGFLFPQHALRNINLALLNFESAHMHFPQPSIQADDGTPLLSWRVSILPFLGEQDLYEQFRLDEPWDSPHNIQLLDLMPQAFAHLEVDNGRTVFLGLDGDGTVFDSTRSTEIGFGQIRDGSSNTISLVEADVSRAVEWTRPVDLAYDSSNPTNGLGGINDDGSFNAVLVTAEAVNFQPAPAADIDAWATIDGGEINDYSFTDLVETELVENQLRNIQLATLNYESANQDFPRTIYSTERESSPEGPGEPLLSWRVRILPFIEQNDLYQQFRLDEPWDSPHNLSLLPLMPRIFASEGVEIGKTVFQGAHGENTFFSNTNRGRNFGSLGSSSITAGVLQVNSDQAIEWTKPGDFDFDPDNLQSILGNATASGFHFATADGATHFFNNTLSNDLLNKIISPRDFYDLDIPLDVFGGSPSLFSSTANVTIQNNLRQLSLAALNYESAFQRFPQHAIYSEPGGTPLLSWRVSLLPFLGRNDLYQRFNLDEPWDSPHNLSLLPLIPSFFQTTGIEDGKTVFQAFTTELESGSDPRTIFPLSSQIRTGFGNIIDGSSNTVLFAQVADELAVEWTKPQDISFNPDDPTAAINTGTAINGTNVVFADGSTHFIPGNLQEESWRRLILANDGELNDWQFPSSYQTGTIELTAPTVANLQRDGGSLDGTGVSRPDLAGPIGISFSENVIVAAGDLEVVNLSSPGSTVDLAGLGFSYDATTFTATWDLSTLTTPLAPGYYDLQIASDAIEASATGMMMDGFQETMYVALPGDTNLDGVVTLSVPNLFTRINTGDVAIARANVGLTGATWEQGDFNGDGVVTLSVPNLFTRINTGDVATARANVGMDVRPPTSSAKAPVSLSVEQTEVVAFEQPEVVSVEQSSLSVSDAPPLELSLNQASQEVLQPVPAPLAMEAPVAALASPVAPQPATVTVDSVRLLPGVDESEVNLSSLYWFAPSAGFVNHDVSSNFERVPTQDLVVSELPTVVLPVSPAVTDVAYFELDSERDFKTVNVSNQLLDSVFSNEDVTEGPEPF